MQELWLIVRTMDLKDVFDILLVATPFYIIFALLRGSGSFAALWGIIAMLLVSLLLYLTAKIGGLQATALIYERFWIIIVLVFLIVFQGELKKALTDVGKTRILRAFFVQQTHAVDEIVKAVGEMAGQKVGALIAVERHITLTPYLGTGTMLDAAISAETIRSVFTPYSPLHDGALLVRGDRLVAAACILPLTDNPRLARELGTRHRAAIGLSEETDALVIVVSEESGTISLAKAGKIERFLQPEDLHKILERELNIESSVEEDEADA